MNGSTKGWTKAPHPASEVLVSRAFESPHTAAERSIRHERDTDRKRYHGRNQRCLRPLLGGADPAFAEIFSSGRRTGHDAERADQGVRHPEKGRGDGQCRAETFGQGKG